MLEDAVEGIASYYRMTLERFQPIMLYESVPTRRFMRNKATKVRCCGCSNANLPPGVQLWVLLVSMSQSTNIAPLQV